MGYAVGIDSRFDLSSKVPGANITYLDDATSWLGAIPAFVARYLGTGGGAATPLSASEVDYVHSYAGKGIPILLCYNDSPINGGTSGTEAVANQDVVNAIAQCEALGVPAGVYVFGDVESNASIQHGYVTGWCNGWRPTIYGGAGGLYGLTGGGQNLGRAYLEALKTDANGNVHRMLLWSARWISTGFSASNAPRWGAIAPSPETAGAVRVWQVTGGTFGGIVDEDMIDESLLVPLTAAGGLWTPPPSSTSSSTSGGGTTVPSGSSGGSGGAGLGTTFTGRVTATESPQGDMKITGDMQPS